MNIIKKVKARINKAKNLSENISHLIAQRNAYVESINILGDILMDNMDNPLTMKIIEELAPSLNRAAEASKRIK